jgi:hypothetical protein
MATAQIVSESEPRLGLPRIAGTLDSLHVLAFQPKQTVFKQIQRYLQSIVQRRTNIIDWRNLRANSCLPPTVARSGLRSLKALSMAIQRSGIGATLPGAMRRSAIRSPFRQRWRQSKLSLSPELCACRLCDSSAAAAWGP